MTMTTSSWPKLCKMRVRGGYQPGSNGPVTNDPAVNDPKEGDILDFDHQESAKPSVEWAPYPSKMVRALF